MPARWASQDATESAGRSCGVSWKTSTWSMAGSDPVVSTISARSEVSAQMSERVVERVGDRRGVGQELAKLGLRRPP